MMSEKQIMTLAMLPTNLNPTHYLYLSLVRGQLISCQYIRRRVNRNNRGIAVGVVLLDELCPTHEEDPTWLTSKLDSCWQFFALTNGDRLIPCNGEHCIVLPRGIAISIIEIVAHHIPVVTVK
jgi:hypothetical protein